jgi:hypothetical protein
MRAGRDEALSIFRTWAVDGALIRCELRFRTLVATFRARVREVSDTRLSLLSDDRWTEFGLPLREDFTFEYGDMRNFPHEGETFERILLVFFPYAGDPADSDHIVFAELKDSPKNPFVTDP